MTSPVGRSADTSDGVDYQRDIQPLFAQKCGACHGALKQEAGLRLDAGVMIHKGSEEGPTIVPGKAADSLLIQRVAAKHADERMPPEGEGAALNAHEVALLRSWIDSGAASPADEIIPADPREHWSYVIPQRPPVPPLKDADWAHPIDAFINREHQRLGLTVVEPADPYTLLRRVYLDLIGLPPTQQQLQAFINANDTSPNAWQRVVDDLLKSSHYGERWGRHWMDVWRYSDWDGYKQQLRGSQRHIWRWRDWIVQSLNADKGYDRMIIEMLAADEVAPNEPEILPATGFLARNYHKSNRNIWLDATVEHTAKAFLGMTLNCARCHDHKFDPIAQTAYYQFRAIFEPHNVRTDQVPGQPNVAKDGLPRAYDADLTAKTFLFLQGNEKLPDEDHPMTPAVPTVLGGNFDVQPVDLPIESYFPSLVTFIEQEQVAAAQTALAKVTKPSDSRPESDEQETNSENRLLDLKKSIADLRLKSLVARYAADRAKVAGDESETSRLARNAASAERQLNVTQAELAVAQKQASVKKAEADEETDEKKKQAAVAAAKKELADAITKQKAAHQAAKNTDNKYTQTGKEYPHTSSGRRLALARWIANEANPLTARVLVNHIWMRHFGQPLVDNIFDFGLRSAKPRHADLLDWLAVELMKNNWSMKHLHRLIVTSRTWQMASTTGETDTSENRTVDRDNDFLWRMNFQRMDAEIIRDNVLAVSGQLDTTMGGADIDYNKGEETRRRSIYLRHAYEKQMTMLVLFDAASPNECYRRSESIIPQQALALLNSTLSLSQSRLLAPELWQAASTDQSPQQSFVRTAFLQILSRPPTDNELAACSDFLTKQSATLSDTSDLNTFIGGTAAKITPSTDPQQRARENLVQVLMNHNDFVTVR
ncbi:MAG: PSD1 and planctomycete cytochrome C domain-containing protein [Fuerstiella sp.]|nr:PSD1 and planctomycete cytochrome C domain-containing protein [Fuerstiella sp.]